MTGHRPFAELRKRMAPERRARNVEATQRMWASMALYELRQARERSQEELARELKVGQPAVAKLERRTDMYVSNLRRYIEALGGSLEITARFPDGTVKITNFSDLGNDRSGKAVLRKQKDPHGSFPAWPAGRRAPPFGAISATMSISGPMAVSAMAASPASPRAVSGTIARAKPSFAASLRRAAACATGRTMPDSEISPK